MSGSKKGGAMKKRGLIFLSIIFIVISLFQFSKVSEAANYNTEIGLTFNTDVATGSDSTSSSKIESSTSETSQTSTNNHQVIRKNFQRQ